jgi:hypothetical protein
MKTKRPRAAPESRRRGGAGDRGREWHRVKANLPTVPIYEITLHPRDNDMLLATHGRSLWILDDLTPFQNYSQAVSSPAHLFAVPAAVQRNPASDRMRDFEGNRRFLGESPEPGAVLTYRLGADAKEVAIEVRDHAGSVVREIRGDEMKEKNASGMHQVAWDLRRAPLAKVKGQDGEGQFGPGDRGPFVLPGSYRAHLIVDGSEASSASLEVKGDPDIAISDSDRARYLETAGRSTISTERRSRPRTRSRISTSSSRRRRRRSRNGSSRKRLPRR